MTTRLIAVGSEFHLVLDPSILNMLRIDEETPLDVTSDGEGLYIRPIKDDHHARVLETAERVMDIHAETLRKLAL